MRKYCCALLMLAACACGPSTPSPKPASPSPDAAAPPTAGPARPPDVKDQPKPVPAQLPDVVARVNGAAVTRAEFEQALREFEERSGFPTPPDQRDQVYRGVLNDLIAFRLLSAELKTRAVTLPTGQLDAAMRELRGQFPSDDAFKQALASQKITADQLREKTRTSLLINQLLAQEVGQDTPVKPGEIAAFYDKNPDRFKQAESVRVSHVLIGLPQGAPEQARAAAQARAHEVLEKARGGADFAALARRYSNDASRARGGDVGFIVRGQASPAFEQAAFTLQLNQISDVVESPYGFHVLKVTDKRQARTVSFGEAAPQIERFLVEQQRQEKTRTYIDRLKTSNKVEILI